MGVGGGHLCFGKPPDSCDACHSGRLCKVTGQGDKWKSITVALPPCVTALSSPRPFSPSYRAPTLLVQPVSFLFAIARAKMKPLKESKPQVVNIKWFSPFLPPRQFGFKNQCIVCFRKNKSQTRKELYDLAGAGFRDDTH